MVELSSAMLDDLILLRLLARDDAPLSKVRADMGPFSTGGRKPFIEAVDRLTGAGRVRAAGPRGGRLQITDAGRLHAREFFQVPPDAAPSPRRGWPAWRDRYAVPRALGTPSLRDADDMRAAMLRRFYLPELSAGLPVTSLRATVDLLLARHLGATGGNGADVRLAVLRAWVNGTPGRPTADQPVPPGDPARGLPEDLPGFAAAVRTAAERCADGRFGGNKVFISRVWDGLLAAGRVRPDALRAFKETLVRANTAGLLRLGRADLAGAQDLHDVRASETPYLGETFHFIRLD